MSFPHVILSAAKGHPLGHPNDDTYENHRTNHYKLKTENYKLIFE
jgi:hypothetical protein